MALINREQVADPALRSEAVELEPLGGSVIVRGLKLSERLRLRNSAGEGGSAERFTAELLAVAVVDGDRRPLWTAEQWDVWGSEHPKHYGALVEKALSLGGFDGAAAKND
jgi:hypothetical protein